MIFDINGESQEIRFTYRVCTAIARQLGHTKITDVEQMVKCIGLDNVPNLIHLGLKETAKKTGDKGKVPNTENILDHLDDSPELFGEFVSAFSDALANIFGKSEDTTPEQRLTAGE